MEPEIEKVNLVTQKQNRKNINSSEISSTNAAAAKAQNRGVLIKTSSSARYRSPVPSTTPNPFIKEVSGNELVASLPNEKKEVVERIFAYYCSFGDPMNSNGLKSSKFIKFLRESGLLKQGVLQNHKINKAGDNNPNRKNQFKQLTSVQADLIFKKLTGLEKPRAHPLIPSGLQQQSQRAMTAKTRQQSLD